MNQSIFEMVEAHYEGTGFCSVPGHMRRVSPTYGAIIALGEKALPDILDYLRNHHGGMSIILLLEDITHTSPYTPQQVTEGHFNAYKVDDAVKAWIEWGKQQGYIQ